MSGGLPIEEVMRWQIMPPIPNERRSVLFTFGYIHVTIIACIYLVGYYCDALNFSVRKATKLVRSLSELMQAVRKLWQK